MRSVRRPAEMEDLVRDLAERPHPVSKRSIFPTMRDLMCFAAVLGFHEGVRTPLGPNTHEIDARIFEGNQAALDLVFLIALAGSKDASILHPDREDAAVTVFEEYAATGLKKLHAWRAERPDDPYGDQAILSGIRRDGHLGDARPHLDEMVRDVAF
jgi:dnd system-associated protein 4